MNKTTLTLIISSILYSNSYAIVEYSGDGRVDFVSPSISVLKEGGGEVISNVRDEILKISSQGAANVCDVNLTEESLQSNTSNNIQCLAQFNNIPMGMEISDGKLSGTFPESGEILLNISLFAISGSQKERILINNKDILINVALPIEPQLNKMLIKSSSGVLEEGLSHTLLSEINKPNSINIEIVPNVYDQKVTIGSESCIVEAGNSKCILDLPELLFSEITGAEELDIKISSLNNYFNKSAGIADLTWDFRPPEFKGIAINNGNRIDNLGDIIASEKTPIDYASIKFALPKNIDNDANNDINPDDISLFIISKNTGKIIDIKNSDLEKINNQEAIVSFSLSDIPDDEYYIGYKASDLYQNSSTSNLDENFIAVIDNTAPTIIIKTGRDIINDTDSPNVTFISDILVSSSEFLLGKEDITNVKINDVDVSFEKVDNQWFRLIPNILTRDNTTEQINMEISALDNAGNITVKETEVILNKGGFNLYDNKEIVHKDIYTDEISVNRSRNITCKMTTEEDASDYTSKFNKNTCYISINKAPVNFKIAPVRGVVKLTGEYSELGQDQIDIDIYSKSIYGETSKVDNIKHDFEVIEPKVPEIKFLTRLAQHDSKYIVGAKERYIGNVYVYADGPVEVTIKSSSPNSEPVTEIIDRGADETFGRLRVVPMPEYTLWENEEITTTVKYLKKEEIFNEEKINLLYAPDSDGITLISEMSDEFAIKDESLNISVTAGWFSARDRTWSFPKDLLGEWDIYIAEKQEDGSLMPITEKMSSTSEKFDFSIDTTGKDVIEIVPVAELNDYQYGYNLTKIGAAMKIRIFDGDGIEAFITETIYTDRDTKNKSARLKLNSTDLENINVISNPNWYLKTPSGTEFNLIEEFKNQKYVEFPLLEKGIYEIKASVENKYSGLMTETPSIPLVNFDNPVYTISGPQNSFIGDEITLSLSYQDIELIDFKELDAEYSTDSGISWNNIENKKDFTISFNEEAKIEVLTRVKDSNSPAEAEVSWSNNSYRVAFNLPRSPVARVSGPYRMEVGENYDITVEVRPPYASFNRGVISEWTFPDETKEIQEGEIFNFTPTSGDLSNGYITLKLSSWIDGYKEESIRDQNIRFRAFEYIWPDFEYSTRQYSNIAPSQARIRLTPYGTSISYLDELNIEYVIPEDMILDYESTSNIAVTITQEGDFTIPINISDARGNKTTLNVPISVVEAEKLTISLKDNMPENNREPVDLNLIAYTEGGHYLDRIESYIWTINGELQDDSSRYLRLYDLLEGEHTVELEINTKFGNKSNYTKSYTIKNNITPICKLEYEEYRTYSKVNSNCVDVDGRVQSYDWVIDGEKTGRSSSLTVLKAMNIEYSDVRLIVEDDSNETKEYIFDNRLVELYRSKPENKTQD